MTTQVSGDLRVITSTPAKITSVDVRSTTTRPSGDGLMLGQWVTLSKPGEFNAAAGEVDFPAVPGPSQIKLFSGGSTVGSVALVVPDAGSASLADCVRNAEMAGDRDAGELAGILEQIRASVGASAEARAGAEAAAEDAAGSAASAGRDADRAETAAGEAATEAAGLAADEVRLDVKADADRSAAGATTATEKAAEAAGSATRAEEAEAGAVEAEEGAVAGQELSEDSAAVAVAAAIGVQAAFHQHTGTGSPEGKVTAPAGATYVDTAVTNGAVRWIKAQGTGNTGWRVQHGDTGWRNITHELTGTVLGMGTGAKVLLRRKLYDLEVLFVGPITLEASWGAVWETSQGFRPERDSETALGENARLRLGVWNARIENGTRDSGLVNSGRSLFATLPSEIDWPSTLPGTPE